ncbi:MAG: Acetyltransferase family [Symbiobacteriaceae bacterium]|jgi:GNAT superfamily N-acetyltransferase|nr:Acetyltransferase family [Symbiobacteriaceae bacterium]
MSTVRYLASPMDLASIPAEGEPLPSAEDCVSPGSLALAAVTDDGTLIGGLLLLPAKRVGDQVLAYKLAWLYVRPEHRRHGVARSLLCKAACAADSRGVHRISVCIRPRNTAGAALFDTLDHPPGAAYVMDLCSNGL